MLVINELFDSFREFQTMLSTSVKSMNLNPSENFMRDISQVKPESLIVESSSPKCSVTKKK